MELFNGKEIKNEEKRELFLQMLELLEEQKLLREEEKNRIKIRLVEYPISRCL